MSTQTPTTTSQQGINDKGRHRTFVEVNELFTTVPVSNLPWTEEPLTCYYIGGCHPVHLGDTFDDGRYEVILKLGCGDSSTVWLAKDTEEDTLVALKIMVARNTSRHEIETLDKVSDVTSLTVPILLDDFVHDGPNGRHLCLVLPLFGPSLTRVLLCYEACPDDERIDADDILYLAKRVLRAIVVLHSAGFAHGDVEANNIVFDLWNMRDQSHDEILHAIGETKTAALRLSSDESPHDDEHMPQQLVGSAEWDEWFDWDEEDVCLIDLAESFPIGDRVPCTPSEPSFGCRMRAPEMLFEDTYDYRFDLWRAGLVLYGICFSCVPYQPMGFDDALIECMIGFLGPLPPEWEVKWQAMREASTDPYTRSLPPSNATPTEQPRLEYVFEKRRPEPELKPVMRAIQGLMRFRPADRIEAREALAILCENDEKDKAFLERTLRTRMAGDKIKNVQP